MTSSEWEVEMEYERRFAEQQRALRVTEADRRNLLKGAGWGMLLTSLILGAAWLLTGLVMR